MNNASQNVKVINYLNLIKIFLINVKFFKEIHFMPYFLTNLEIKIISLINEN